MSERLCLEIVDAGRPPAELPRAGTLVLGSSKERASFVVSGAGVAEIHAAIGRAKGGGWAIRDLGSDAGTKLNGKRIDAARLAAGDRLELGAVRLRVFDPARPGAQPAAAVPAPAAGSDTAAVELVDTPPRGMNAVQPEPAASAELPAIPGYRLEKRIGRGGMGEVYLALQERLARPVAIKALSRKLAADEQFVRRFEAEARAAAALNHPNVVTVYDVGEHAGVHYLSMEYMDRGTLEDRVQREGALPWKSVLEILRDAAGGLAYAESRGIVHRDLKPANLMQNHAGATKIADLGLATHIEAEEQQSAEKKVFGTAHFMAPEQARGEKVDHRSDLYALGATAYRLLTAHTPYEGATSRDILRAMLREDPRPIAALKADVPAPVIALVERLMRKDPAQRFGSARELLLEIERLRTADSAAPAASASGAAPARSSKGVLISLLVVAAGGAAAFVALRERGSAPAPLDPGHAPTTAQHAPSGTTPVEPTPTSSSAQVPPTDPRTTPGPGPAGDPGSTSSGGKPRENDEQKLELFETQARVALLEIVARQMEPKERIAALREMAEKFRGSNSAAEATERADALEAEANNAEAAASTHHSNVLALSQKLRAAAALDTRPFLPGKALLAMRAVEGQAAYENDPLFQGEKTRLEQEVLTQASEYAKTVLEDTQKDLEKGEHESAKKKLTELMPVFDLPDFPLGKSPLGTDVLFELGRRARERLSNLGQIASQIQTQQSREETLALAQSLSGPDALERELAAFDFAAAHARVAALGAKATTPAAKVLLGDLDLELAGARRAFDLVAREFPAGWKRKGVDDPRDKSEALRSVVGADADGLMLEAQGGAVERLPWTAFARNTKVLNRLFVERLTREYTSDEARDVMALVHLTAVSEALELAGKMFDPAKKANFTEGNAKDLVEGFNAAQGWSAKAGAPSNLLAHDAAAAELLARVLQDTTNGAWSNAVAGTERLLRENQDSLLVRMLSDGTQPK